MPNMKFHGMEFDPAAQLVLPIFPSAPGTKVKGQILFNDNDDKCYFSPDGSILKGFGLDFAGFSNLSRTYNTSGVTQLSTIDTNSNPVGVIYISSADTYSLTALINGVANQLVFVVLSAVATAVTFTNGSNLKMLGGVNYHPPAGDILLFICTAYGLPNVWQEVVRSGGDYGYKIESTTTTTPDVTGVKTLIMNSAGGGNITNFSNGQEGQKLTVIFAVARNITSGSNFLLEGGADFTGNVNDVLDLVYYNSKWYERNRSLNS